MSYNQLFERFVLNTESEENKMIGLLAYGDYKVDKADYFREYERQKGQPPTQQDIDNYLIQYNKRKRDELRKNAEFSLFQFADIYTKKRQKEIKNKAITDKVIEDVKTTRDEIESFIKKKLTFQSAVHASFWGAFVWALFIAATIFIFNITMPESAFVKFGKALWSQKDFKITIEEVQK